MKWVILSVLTLLGCNQFESNAFVVESIEKSSNVSYTDKYVYDIGDLNYYTDSVYVIGDTLVLRAKN